VGAISYLFQVSTSPNFSPVVASATVGEQSGQTSWKPGVDLPTGTIYWRVQASDPANAETSPFSTVTSFTLNPFDMRNAVIHANPPDMGSWPETAKITHIDLTGDRVIVDFDRRLSSDHWPESSDGYGAGGTTQYTLGLCARLGDGRYHCSAVVHFWLGRELEAGGGVWTINADWFYGAQWGDLQGYQPQPGEMVGLFVGQGTLRLNTSGSDTYKERSNVQFVPWGTEWTIK